MRHIDKGVRTSHNTGSYENLLLCWSTIAFKLVYFATTFIFKYIELHLLKLAPHICSYISSISDSRLSTPLLKLGASAAEKMKMKSFAMAKPILIICLFLASEIVQATQDKASIQPETGQLDHANCDQPEFNNRPVLMAKRSYPPRPSAVELTYLKGFSTIHDITKSFTIRIRCSANYNVTIDAHNLILVFFNNKCVGYFDT